MSSCCSPHKLCSPLLWPGRDDLFASGLLVLGARTVLSHFPVNWHRDATCGSGITRNLKRILTLENAQCFFLLEHNFKGWLVDLGPHSQENRNVFPTELLGNTPERRLRSPPGPVLNTGTTGCPPAPPFCSRPWILQSHLVAKQRIRQYSQDGI